MSLSGLLGIGLLGLSPLADPLTVAATLLTAALAASLRLSPDLIGMPAPPTVGGILTCRTAISRLGIFGLEEPLATF